MALRVKIYRYGFTLVELIVVVMILGILASIAAPRLLGTSDKAVDNGLRHSLSVIRTAIDSYAAEHPGELPGADGQQQTFKDDIAPYLRGNAFPSSPVGAKNNEIRLLGGAGPITTSIGGTAATHGWVYQYETGAFHANNTATASDGTTTYDEF